MLVTPVGRLVGAALASTRAFVVAIPVKNEAERLPACLAAIAGQSDRGGRPLPRARVVVFANNCEDESASLARRWAKRLRLPLRVVEATLPPAEAHAGAARRAAMDIAESWLARGGAPDGVILTTDADSRPSPLWIANSLAAIDAGADAALGRIALDEEGDALPAALHQRGALESAYEALLAELSARLDPLPHNPWPHHSTISGASLAVTRAAYLRAGRLPCAPLGEDRAFVAALLRVDARIRYCPDVHVTTSGRLNGRASGGVADTLRRRCDEPDAVCDEVLEAFPVAWRRGLWRARLRRLWKEGFLASERGWARGLAIADCEADRIGAVQAFGAAWSAVEAASPLLARRPLRPSQLPQQIGRARRAVAALRGLSAPEDVEPELGSALGPLDDHRLPQFPDEQLGSLVAT